MSAVSLVYSFYTHLACEVFHHPEVRKRRLLFCSDETVFVVPVGPYPVMGSISTACLPPYIVSVGPYLLFPGAVCGIFTLIVEL